MSDKLDRICFFLNQKELARRWGVSVHTLERWRSCGKGSRFLKFSDRIRYDVRDVEVYEVEHLANRTLKFSPVD
jgi:transposase-like protein